MTIYICLHLFLVPDTKQNQRCASKSPRRSQDLTLKAQLIEKKGFYIYVHNFLTVTEAKMNSIFGIYG